MIFWPPLSGFAGFREDLVVALETRLLLGFASNEVAAARSEVSCHIARSAERWWERVLRFVLIVALRKRRQHREELWLVQQGQEPVGCRKTWRDYSATSWDGSPA